MSVLTQVAGAGGSMASHRSRVLQVSDSSSSSSDDGGPDILPCSSRVVIVAEDDDDDDDDVQFLDALEPPLPTSVNSSSRPPASAQIDISPPFSSLPQSLPHWNASLESLLHSRGVRPTPQWLTACVDHLSATRPGFRQLPLPVQAEICFSSFLLSDLNRMGASCLPPELHSLHATELEGPFVLQVDEIADIATPIRSRYKERPASTTRCLKLSMTDGNQRVFGIEYRPIKDLNVLSPAGLKVAIHHVNIRRGLLMLVPEVIIILGGFVEELEAARQRVVQHVKKPPRGTRNITGSTQSLAESASTIAWASSPMESAINPVRDVPRQDLEDSNLTYLSLLKKSWSSNQRNALNMVAKVKCVITGVKEFHYRNVSQYKLLVYIDDGSEIVTVKIDPHIIENIVGFPPSKASNALASSRPEEASMIRENMARFQTFLAKFEGTLYLQKENNSECLVAVKMKEGCSNSDAWQLANRIHFATGSAAADTTMEEQIR